MNPGPAKYELAGLMHSRGRQPVRYHSSGPLRRHRGCSSMAEFLLPKQTARVRFPSPAPSPGPRFPGPAAFERRFRRCRDFGACNIRATVLAAGATARCWICSSSGVGDAAVCFTGGVLINECGAHAVAPHPLHQVSRWSPRITASGSSSVSSWQPRSTATPAPA
jgi:hypothetical protein